MICTGCNEELPETAFPWKNKAAGKKGVRCNVCMRIYIRSHYNANKAYYLQKTKLRNEEVRGKVRDLLWEVLKAAGCTDCGEPDPVVLEFDHISDKTTSVAALVSQNHTWPRILREIAKCEVVCANCHRRRTYSRCDSWRMSR